MSRQLWNDIDSYISKRRSAKKRKLDERLRQFKKRIELKAKAMTEVMRLRKLGLKKRDFELLNKDISGVHIIHREKSFLKNANEKIRFYLKNRKEEKLQHQVRKKKGDIQRQVEESRVNSKQNHTS